jgi:hypothetical protein
MGDWKVAKTRFSDIALSEYSLRVVERESPCIMAAKAMMSQPKGVRK